MIEHNNIQDFFDAMWAAKRSSNVKIDHLRSAKDRFSIVLTSVTWPEGIIHQFIKEVGFSEQLRNPLSAMGAWSMFEKERKSLKNLLEAYSFIVSEKAGQWTEQDVKELQSFVL